jgi:hypothetical protein
MSTGNKFRKIFPAFYLNFGINVGWATLGRNFGINIGTSVLGRNFDTNTRGWGVRGYIMMLRLGWMYENKYFILFTNSAHTSQKASSPIK